MRRVFNALFTLFVTAAAAYGYGYLQGQKKIEPADPSIAKPQEVDTQPVATTDTTLESQTPPTKTDEDKPAVSGKHTVKAGETLFTIGLQYDVLWTTIAQANNISENTPLIEGQELIIPVDEQGKVQPKETLAIDEVKVDEAQSHVANNDWLWRQDPVATVRQTTPVEYHLKNDDTYTLANFDNEIGQATVIVNHDQQVYTIELVQPKMKGATGVWFISTITTSYISNND